MSRHRPLEGFTWYHCRQAHRQYQRADVLLVLCPQCQHDPTWSGTCEMKPVEQFPNWPKVKVAS